MRREVRKVKVGIEKKNEEGKGREEKGRRGRSDED